MKNIGEQLDYSTLAKLHRPDDAETLSREARALAAIGFKPRDIADALNLAPAAVAFLLNPKET